MQALSRREEQEVMDRAKLEAEVACQDQVKAFADCATGRTITMSWACNDLLKAMRKCMYDSVPEKRIDELKGEYIKDREQRKIEALANYKKERIEAMKRHAGIKDGPI